MSAKIEGERFEWFLKPGAVKKKRWKTTSFEVGGGVKIKKKIPFIGYGINDFEFLSVGGFCPCRCEFCGKIHRNVKDFYCRFQLFRDDQDDKNGDLIKVFRHYKKLCGPCAAKAMWMNKRSDDIIEIRKLIRKMENAIHERNKNSDNRTAQAVSC